MGQTAILAGLILMAIIVDNGDAMATATKVDSQRSRFRPLKLTPKHVAFKRLKADPFAEFILDEDLFELAKRQTSDDYGHMRFGKRDEQFEDYGHMRFGRSGLD